MLTPPTGFSNDETARVRRQAVHYDIIGNRHDAPKPPAGQAARLPAPDLMACMIFARRFR